MEYNLERLNLILIALGYISSGGIIDKMVCLDEDPRITL